MSTNNEFVEPVTTPAPPTTTPAPTTTPGPTQPPAAATPAPTPQPEPGPAPTTQHIDEEVETTPTTTPEPTPTPGPTPGPTQPPKTESEESNNSGGTQEDSYTHYTGDDDLFIPLKFNEITYDVSICLTSALEDFMDSLIQAKSVSGDFTKNSVWDSEVVCDAIQEAIGSRDLSETINSRPNSDGDFTEYGEDIITNLYAHFDAFSDYATELEYNVALIQDVMRNANEKGDITDAEYNDFLSQLSNHSFANYAEFDEFVSNLGYTARLVGKSAGPLAGAAWHTAFGGIPLLNLFQKSGYSRLCGMTFQEFKTKSLDLYLKGTPIPETGTGKFFVSKLGSTTAVAALIFATTVGYDYVTGDFSWEKVKIRGTRAGVSVVASMAGFSVTSALASAGVGAAAGPIGIAVAVVGSIVGNLIIDAFVAEAHRYDVPETYEAMSMNDVRATLREQGVILGTPTIAGMSTYDAITRVTYDCDNQNMVSYLTNRCFGYQTLDDATTYKYDRILNMFFEHGDDFVRQQMKADDRYSYIRLFDEDGIEFYESLMELYNSNDKNREIITGIKNMVYKNMDENFQPQPEPGPAPQPLRGPREEPEATPAPAG